jgi:uncharacterized protein YecE (DUF72 family)
MVHNWVKKTHKDFKFTAKFPKVITHEKRLKDVDKELEYFFEAIAPFSHKTPSDTTPSIFADFRGPGKS